jgi:hypothetical protein
MATLATKNIPEASAPALSLRDLSIEADGSGQAIVLRFIARPQIEQFNDITYAARDELSAAVEAAKQSFPEHPAYRQLVALEAKRKQTQTRRVEAQQRATQEKMLADQALAKLDTDKHEPHFRAAAEAKADAEMIGEQLAAIDQFLDKSRKEAKNALVAHINAKVTELEREAKTTWERIAADIVKGLPLASVVELFRAGQRLSTASNWRPSGSAEERNGVFELPTTV